MINSRLLVVRWSDTEHVPYDDLIPEEWIYSRQSERGLFHAMESRKGILISAKCDLVVKKDAIELNYAGENSEFNNANDIELGSMDIRIAPTTHEVTQVLWRAITGSKELDVDSLPFEWRVEIDADDEDEEGGVRLSTHRTYERSQKLRKQKINAVLRKMKRLACEACEFDFKQTYGDKLGEGFCEVHHTRPLYDTGKVTTRHSDLAVLCANCHRIIHRSLNKMGEMLTVSQLKVLVQEQANGNGSTVK